MNKQKNLRGFVAFPSSPKSISDGIEIAVDEINAENVVELISWKSLRTSGNLIIEKILEEIREADFFICDLTFLNPNVIFELGYAIANNKRIWVTLNTSYADEEKRYKEAKLFSGIGYSGYKNSYEILELFFDQHPYDDLGNTLFQALFDPINTPEISIPHLFYLKCLENTNESSMLSQEIDNINIKLITDDPDEVRVQTLSWYAENVVNAQAIVSHMLDEERGKNKQLESLKYPFISGLAYGLEKPTLMLAHSPYKAPFDYQDLMVVHDSVIECKTAFNKWITPIEQEHQAIIEKSKQRKRRQSGLSALRMIQLGDSIAENEIAELDEYFIETSSYFDALNVGQYMIFVGRKGSGKTANLYRVSEKLKSDKRNFVCIIKPISYDLINLLDILEKSISKSEKGYLYESLWKLLIYTQIANQYYSDLNNLPSHYQLSDEEEEFIHFIESNSELILDDFSSRLGKAVKDICELNSNTSNGISRIKVSEILHSNFIPMLRKQLGLMLEEKSKVCILIDNLDKAWVQGESIELLSDFIFSLLGVSRRITEDFQRESGKYRPVKLSLIIFLRSDIFSHLYSVANEADKINYSVMGWNDSLLLKRVIEERFLHKLNSNFKPEHVWSDLFVKTIDGIETSRYILERIIPRPRDIIYFCKSALSFAVNRNHTKINKEDLYTAEEEYSNYAYRSLIAELKPEFENAEKYLFEFIGLNSIVTKDELQACWIKENLSIENTENLFQHLVRSLFLGVEVEENQFEFLYDEQREKIVTHLSKKYKEKSGIERYKINTPFIKYLEIKE